MVKYYTRVLSGDNPPFPGGGLIKSQIGNIRPGGVQIGEWFSNSNAVQMRC